MRRDFDQSKKSKKKIDDFEQIAKLGEGAEGEVWSVRDKEKNCFQILKIFKEADNSEEELSFIHKLGFENIMGVNDIFKTSEGKMCYTMDFAWHGDLYYKMIEYAIIEK